MSRFQALRVNAGVDPIHRRLMPVELGLGACRWWVGGLLACLVALLPGCSTKFLYHHADWLVLRQLDRYFDLSDEQRAVLSARLNVLLARHKREALPRYEAFLRQVQERVRRGVTAGDFDWALAQYQELRGDLLNRLVDDGGVLLASLSEAQIGHAQEAFRNTNEHVERELRQDRPKRLAARAKKTVDWLKDWLGSLTPEQEQRIAQLSLALPDTLPAWLEYHQRRQARFLALLAVRRDRAELTRRLHEWIVEPEGDAPPAYRSAVQAMQEASKAMAVAIDRLATPEQRRHVVAKLQDLINTVHELQET